MSGPVRPCGCGLDEPDHLEPEPDWIGDSPIMHGEREEWPTEYDELARAFSGPCLCGHPVWLDCPEAWGGGLEDLVISVA